MKVTAYPWKNVIWDIAIEKGGMVPYFVEYQDTTKTAKFLPEGLDAELFQAIFNGVIEPLDKNGVPILRPIPSQLVDSAHVTEVSVNQWLRRSRFKFTWNPAAAQKKREKAQRKQEKVILVAIKSMNLDPQSLKEEPFKLGDKSAVRNLVLRKSPELFGTEKVFDKAWERLQAIGDIRSPQLQKKGKK
jgi:hypothetical protein